MTRPSGQELRGIARTRAGWWRRALAALIDAAISSVGVFALLQLSLSPPWATITDPELFPLERAAVSLATRPGAWVTFWLVLHLPWGFLQAAFAVAERETPGMRLAGVMLVDAHGEVAHAGRRLTRACFWWALPCSLYLLGVWVVGSRAFRGVHDRAAGLWAVRRVGA